MFQKKWERHMPKGFFHDNPMEILRDAGEI